MSSPGLTAVSSARLIFNSNFILRNMSLADGILLKFRRCGSNEVLKVIYLIGEKLKTLRHRALTN